ncbi:hypothetical protein HPB52_008951 [Rhipicephalus sanguineus]|uniref:Uncharacterized protein n=1 Tax=Rhipicephalus sanguineus TaxID=34632 RepID=A0A9D4SUJ1_RHISA|nr:hypothetical protein HPB52_008951 [Rhipicephalus sanguineus]
MRSGLATLLAVVSLHTWTALSLRVLDHRLFGATRTIKLKPCQNRVTGQEGTCMFAWDCFSAGGTHLTYCTDSFYTGSCCKLPPGVVVQQHDQPSEPTNSIDSAPYEGDDDDYKKRTKRPPTSTPKTTLQMSSKTTQPGNLRCDDAKPYTVANHDGGDTFCRPLDVYARSYHVETSRDDLAICLR